MTLLIRQAQMQSLEATLNCPAIRSCDPQLKIWVRLEVNPCDPARYTERFVLTGPGYRAEKAAPSQCVAGQHIDLIYEGIHRSARYTLEVQPGDNRPVYTLFENLTFDELRATSGAN